MAEWDRGYVSDTEYPGGIVAEQTPGLLNLACLINGIAPVETAAGFRYCELGCGQGIMLCLLAAANPHGEFHGIDFMPEHIARAQAMAAAAGLDNVFFHEASFEELEAAPDDQLPVFDFVTLHGVYTWVSPATQAAIRNFLLRRLRSGGIAYFGVNVMPGWEPAITLQRLLLEIGGLERGSSRRRMEQAFQLLERLAAAGPPDLPLARALGSFKEQFGKADIRGAVHELLNQNWRPLLFADLARDLAAAKLTHVGSAVILDNFSELNFSPKQRAIFAELDAPELVETFKDVCLGRTFRREIFCRGAVRLDGDQQARRLEQLPVAVVATPSQIGYTVQRPFGDAELEPAVFAPLYAALAERPRRLGDLVGLARAAGHAVNPVEIVGMLVGSYQAMPGVAAESMPATPAIHRFNRLTADRVAFRGPGRMQGAAAATLGAGLALDPMEWMAYHVLTNGAAGEATADRLAREIWRLMQARGAKVIQKNQAVDGEEASLRLLEGRMTALLAEQLPLWRQLGAI